MDSAAAAALARSELQSYALRRCIRFHSAILLAGVTWALSHGAASLRQARMVAIGGAVLLAVLALVEVASGLAIRRMEGVRDRQPGPETGLWRFVQGWLPSLVAAAFFLALAGAQFVALRVVVRA